MVNPWEMPKTAAEKDVRDEETNEALIKREVFLITD